MHIEIQGLGTATPPHKLDQGDALAMAQKICCTTERQSRLAAALYRHSGVKNRHTAVPYSDAYRWAPDAPAGDRAPHVGPTTEERMALYQEHALPLAVESSRAALEQADCPPSEISYVVTASCTGFTAPGVDSGLIQRLDLRRTTQRVNVGYMGCHGSINALRTARGLALAEPRGRVLLCAVELCSLHYTFHWDGERMLGNALFADGSAAAVIAAQSPPPLKGGARGGITRRWRLAATGSYLFPETADAMTWSVGNHGFAMTISSRLPELIQAHLALWLTAWLDEHGLKPADIASWAVHPGGPRILEAVESAMNLSREQTHVSREVLANYGNMSSATVLFIVESLIARGARPPCVMLGFGPGLVAEAALLL